MALLDVAVLPRPTIGAPEVANNGRVRNDR
jgi:hypothetical protein